MPVTGNDRVVPVIVIQRQNMAGRNRVIGTCFNTVVRITAVIAQVGTPVEVGEADVAQLAAPQIGNRHKVLHFETVTVPLVFVRCAVVLPLVFRIDVHGQVHRQTSIDVGTQTHVPGALAAIFITTHVVNVVVREVPLFERTEAKVSIGQLVNGETRFDFHKQRRTVVPDTFCIGVTAEEYRRIRITIEVEPVFFSECFVLKVGIVAELRSETGVIASDNVNALVPPVGKILRFVVFSCVDSKRRRERQYRTGCQ